MNLHPARLVDAQARIGEQAVAIEAFDVVALDVLPSPQMLTSSSRIRDDEHLPVTARPSGVVLKYVAPPVEM